MDDKNLKIVFDVLDYNKDGLISEDEIIQAQNNLNIEESERKIWKEFLRNFVRLNFGD